MIQAEDLKNNVDWGKIPVLLRSTNDQSPQGDKYLHEIPFLLFSAPSLRGEKQEMNI